jgi:hypothetical protein
MRQLECDLSLFIADKVKTFSVETGFVPHLSVRVYGDTLKEFGKPDKEYFRNVEVEADVTL